MSEPIFLYVENDELSREVMRAMVTRGLGYDNITILETSAYFEESLKKLASTPDVIFLDIHIEPIDGFEMLTVIRQHDEFGKIPVIALTASVMNEEVRRLREAGFDGVIAKPINYDIFPMVLDRILNGEQIWNIK